MHLLNKIMKWCKVTLFYWGTIKHVDRFYIYNCGMTKHDFTNSNSAFSIGIICSLLFLMYSVLSLL